MRVHRIKMRQNEERSSSKYPRSCPKDIARLNRLCKETCSFDRRSAQPPSHAVYRFWTLSVCLQSIYSQQGSRVEGQGRPSRATIFQRTNPYVVETSAGELEFIQRDCSLRFLYRIYYLRIKRKRSTKSKPYRYYFLLPLVSSYYILLQIPSHTTYFIYCSSHESADYCS